MLDAERTIDTQAAEIKRLRAEVMARDRADANERKRWREHPLMERLDALRADIAGMRPGAAEWLATAQSEFLDVEARALAAEAEIERLRASLDEAVGVMRQIADRAGDGRRTASLPVIAREARDFITKHGGGRPAEQGVVMDFREEVQELTAIIRRQALNPNHGGERE
jgi:hypothetical protein